MDTKISGEHVLTNDEAFMPRKRQLGANRSPKSETWGLVQACLLKPVTAVETRRGATGSLLLYKVQVIEP